MAPRSPARPSRDGPLFPTGWTLLVGLCCALAIALTTSTQVHLSMWDHGHSFARIFGWHFSTWLPWALLAPWIIGVGASLGDGARWTAALTARTVGLGLILMLMSLLGETGLMMWLQPYAPVDYYSLREAFELQVYGIPADILPSSAMLLAGYTAAMNRRTRALEAHEARLEADLTRAQLDALRVELAPHFLFNALHSIAALIRTQSNDRALSMLLGLSDLLRTAVDGAGANTAPLASEIGLVTRYVDLQQLRFGDRLDVRVSVAPGTESCEVPTLLLQPLVENAFRHGIARQTGRCRLEIGSILENGVLHLWVQDDGAGLAPGFRLEETAGTGLRNVRLRLQRLYGDAATVTLTPADGGGTLVRLNLPARHEPHLATQRVV
jgi:two-component system, LytTR family, sensor kinase